MVVYDKDDLAPQGIWPVVRSHSTPSVPVEKYDRLAAEHTALKEDYDGLGQTLGRTVVRCAEANHELKTLKVEHAALVAAAKKVESFDHNAVKRLTAEHTALRETVDLAGDYLNNLSDLALDADREHLAVLLRIEADALHEAVDGDGTNRRSTDTGGRDERFGRGTKGNDAP